MELECSRAHVAHGIHAIETALLGIIPHCAFGVADSVSLILLWLKWLITLAFFAFCIVGKQVMKLQHEHMTWRRLLDDGLMML
jgi:hypothetical protein